MYIIYMYIYNIYIFPLNIRYSEEKNSNIFRKLFRHFAFINKTYAKIHYKSYNNYKCHHRNKINNLPIKKIIDLPIKL